MVVVANRLIRGRNLCISRDITFLRLRVHTSSVLVLADRILPSSRPRRVRTLIGDGPSPISVPICALERLAFFGHTRVRGAGRRDGHRNGHRLVVSLGELR